MWPSSAAGLNGKQAAPDQPSYRRLDSQRLYSNMRRHLLYRDPAGEAFRRDPSVVFGDDVQYRQFYA
jgi:hypothetical protein